MFFIYGIYVVIFGLSVHVLSRRDGPSSKLYMRGTVILFVLATLFVASVVFVFSQQAGLDFEAVTTKNYAPFLKFVNEQPVWFSIGNFVGCFVTAIADAMLIHRCCIIWQSGIMMYLLGSVAVILNGIYIGCTIAGVIAWSTSNFSLYIRASIIFNATGLAIAVFQVILALLTGGRIWWISREARRLMGRSTNRKYNSITAIIIESGMLYAGFQISSNVLLFIIDPTDSAGLFPIDLSPLAGLMAGLAPTLIIVRVAYGKSVDSVQQMVSTLQITSPEENSQRSRPGDDLQLRTQIGGYVQSVSETPLPVPAMSEEMA